MHYDESLPALRQPAASAGTNPGNKPPATRWTKDVGAAPGGVPPMFAGPAQAVGLASPRTWVEG